jgi:hypothetical protein
MYYQKCIHSRMYYRAAANWYKYSVLPFTEAWIMYYRPLLENDIT